MENQTINLNSSPEYDLNRVSEEERQALLMRWRGDAKLYFVERLGIPEEMMDEPELRLLEALPDCIINRQPLVVPSCNAGGKDFTISGRAVLWFYECFAPCKIIMSGPSERQVETIMWNELKFAYASRPVQDDIGRLVNLRLEGSPDWFITAYTTKETQGKTGKFHGIHADRLMIVISEAQAVDKEIYEQIQGMTMADVCLVCYLGNPLQSQGPFVDLIEDPVNNKVVRLDAYDYRNVKEKRRVIPGLVSWPWVLDKEEKWNADGSGSDPRYMARVRGLVPTTSINTVVSKQLYKACINRELTWWSALYGTIGVDPALTGEDDMVISVFKSGRLVDEWVIPYNENEVVAAGKIQIKLTEHFPSGGAVMVIDSDGLGIKVHNAFQKMLPKSVENPNILIEYRGSCNDRKIVDPQYENTRADAHFYAKQRMMDGHISLDDNDWAREEATAVLHFVNKRGRIQIEDKDDLKSRLLRSPNRWDARVCGIWGFKFARQIMSKDEWRASGRGQWKPGGSAMSA